MKLLITGLVLVAAAIGALAFDLNPATPLIGGIACTFLGVIDVIARPGGAPAVSDSDMTDAKILANVQTHGTFDSAARPIDS